MRKGAILLLVLSLVLVACRASTAEPTVLVDRAGGSTTARPTTDPPPRLWPAGHRSSRAKTVMRGRTTHLPGLHESDDFGPRPDEIENRPDRIVSLSATATEMLYAVGAGEQVVATDLTSNYRPMPQHGQARLVQLQRRGGGRP